jgi:hypothetical protein
MPGMAMGFSVVAARPPVPADGAAGIPGMPDMSGAIPPFVGVAFRFAVVGFAEAVFALVFGFVEGFRVDAGLVVRLVADVADTFGFGCDVFGAIVMPGIPAMPCMGRRVVSCCACAADVKIADSASMVRAKRAIRTAPRAGGGAELSNIECVLEASN